jgi:hypothetical protein
VPTALDTEQEVAFARKTDSCYYVRDAKAARDESRPLVDHGVPDLPRFLVPGVLLCKDGSPVRQAKRLDVFV